MPNETTDAQLRELLSQPTNAPSMRVSGAVPSSLSVPASTEELLPHTTNTIRKLGDLNVSFTQPSMAPTSPESPLVTASGVVSKSPQQKYEESHQVGDVPVDASEEVSGLTRLMLGFRQSKEREVKYLMKKYPGTVRMTKDGEIFVRMVDAKTGKPKDIPADSPSINLNDFLDIAGAVPEIAGAIVASRTGQKLPFMKGPLGASAKDIAAQTLGAETVGAITDIGTELMDTGSVDLGQMGKERAASAAAGAAIGGLTIPVGRFLNWAKAPLHGSRGQVQFDAMAAQKYFKDTRGHFVPLSIAESTGNPLFGRTEVFTEQMPGGSGPIREAKRIKDESLRKLQSILMGGIPETDEEVGNRAIAEIQRQVAPAKQEASKAVEQLGKSVTGKISTEIGTRLGTAERLYPNEVGAALRNKVTELRDAAKEVSRLKYEAVDTALANFGPKPFPADTLATEAENLLKKLPSTGTVPLSDFAPPDVIGRLKQLASLKGKSLSLSDLTQMRRDTYEAIGKGEGVPGRGAHYLNEIGKMLTKAIDDGANSLPGPAKRLLDQAQKHYKEEVVPFSKIGITEMFRDPTDAGYLGDFALAKKAMTNPDIFRVIKERLGENSIEFKGLRRAIADDLLQTAKLPDGRFDAIAFAKKLADFQKESREISDSVFGKDISKLTTWANQMRETTGLKLDNEEVQRILAKPTITEFRKAVAAQKKVDDLYRNDILRKIASNSLNVSEISPEDFVGKLLDSSSVEELRTVLGMVAHDPALLEDIQGKTIQTIFNRASRRPTAEDINLIFGPERTDVLSGTAIAAQLKNQTFQEKVKMILGPRLFNDIEQYSKLIATSESREAGFSAGGGIAAGMQISRMEQGKISKFIDRAAKTWINSKLITNKFVHRWMTNTPASEDPSLFLTILTNPQFLEMVTKEFGEGTGAERFIRSIKASMDEAIIRGQGKTQEPQGSDQELRQLLMQPTTRNTNATTAQQK